ncbi:MAG: hypothetical protein ACLP9S_04855 [Syntrophales bacterium]|jgi:hypothetical protein
MKKAACAVLIFTMIIFLVNPLPSDAGGGHWGGYWGWWWAPWAVIGSAAVLAPYYAPYYYGPYYYAPYYAPPSVVIREQPQVYVQPAPSAQPSTERLFVYARQGQSEELQAKDRYECHSWAVSQTHYDPTQPVGGMSQAQLNQIRSNYQRAIGACLDGRGYTTR